MYWVICNKNQLIPYKNGLRYFLKFDDALSFCKNSEMAYEPKLLKIVNEKFTFASKDETRLKIMQEFHKYRLGKNEILV